MGCYTSTQRRIEVAREVFEGELEKHETVRDQAAKSVSFWTKTVEFPAGRHLRKLDFGCVVHDKFEIDPAVPHSCSLSQNWHFIHFLWFPMTLDGSPFLWDDLAEFERSGNSYRIRFQQKRCELVKRKFYIGEKKDHTRLTPEELERDVMSENFARIFQGDRRIQFNNQSEVPMRVRTGSKLESRLDPNVSKTLRFDSKNDLFFSILALYGGDWHPLPTFTECSLDGETSYTLSNSHIETLEQGILMSNSDLCYGGDVIIDK